MKTFIIFVLTHYKSAAGRGFSLVEVLAAVSIIGIITFLAIPNIVRVKQDGEENLVRARAESINLGIASYVQTVGPTMAQSAWNTAGTDQGRFALVRPYISFADAALTNFMPGSYTAVLPAVINPLTTKATIAGPRGSIAY